MFSALLLVCTLLYLRLPFRIAFLSENSGRITSSRVRRGRQRRYELQARRWGAKQAVQCGHHESNGTCRSGRKHLLMGHRVRQLKKILLVG